MTKRWTLLLIAAALLIVSGMEADAQDTPPSHGVVFWSAQGPMAVKRPSGIAAHDPGPPDPQRLIEQLLEGPTPQEERDGLRTAIPSGTTVASVLQPAEEMVVVRLEIPGRELERIDHEAFEVIVRQIGATLRPLAWGDLRIQVRDPASGDFVALAEFLPEIEVPVKPSSAGYGEPEPSTPAGGQPPAPGQGQPNGTLSGKTVYVSADTGMVAVEDVEQRRIYDPVTGDEDNIHELEVSYAFKLLLDEMKALGIRPRLELVDAV